jgi:hypothetical protein
LHWRAAIVPNVRIGECVGGERVRSVVTPDDFASETEAELAAQNLISHAPSKLCRSGRQSSDGLGWEHVRATAARGCV